MKDKNCYNCIYCVSNIDEFEIWCSASGRLIDDSYGEIDDDICDLYHSKVKVGIYSVVDDELPF